MVDVLRGVALAAMALFHLTWDLGHLRLTPENWALAPLGRAAAHGIAGSFLALVGLSLVLAQGAGFRPRPFGLRLARIAGAAALISAATWFVFPQSWIFFGVLHCIALSSLLALPALRAPLALVAVAAVAVVALPGLLAAAGGGPGWLDAPTLLFLGLGRTVPDTNDYVPLFPWFGWVLAGVAAGRVLPPRLAASRLGHWRPAGPAGRGLAWAGRHSLAVYLLHQPLLFALLSGVAAVTGPHPRAGEAEFLRSYAASCREAGGAEAVCRDTSRCLLGRLREEGLWRGDLTPEERGRAVALAQACFEGAERATR
ncbi:MAG: heparan-alpha-glucosaminide N-acetyltransferase [Methylobacterium frigidaeris]